MLYERDPPLERGDAEAGRVRGSSEENFDPERRRAVRLEE